MSENRLPIDDPRLTAYALGELAPDEAAEIERLIAESPASGAAVDEIRELAGLLTDQLRQEPAPALSDAQRVAILHECDGRLEVKIPAQPTLVSANRRAMRFASLITLTAMVMIAFLITPADRSLPVDNLGDRTRPGPYYRRDDLQRDLELASKGQHSLIAEEATRLNLYVGVESAPVDFSGAAGPISHSDSGATEGNGAGSGIPGGGPGVSGGAGGGSLGGARGLGHRRDRVSFPHSQPMSKESAGGVSDEPVPQSAALPAKGVAGARNRAFSVPVTVDALEAELSGLQKSDSQSGPERKNEGQGRGDVAGKPVQQSVEFDGRVPTLKNLEMRPAIAESAKQIVPAFKTKPVADGIELNQLQRQAGARFSDKGEGESRQEAGQPGEKTSLHRSPYLRSRAKEGQPSDFDQPLGEINSPEPGLSGKPGEEPAKVGNVDQYSNALNSVDEADPKFVADIGYPDAAKWRQLVERRRKWAAESLADLSLHEALGTEVYEPIVENPFVSPTAQPLSTFSVDVDTASYANVRRFITGHQLPPRNAVRIEELVNYFSYDYQQPAANQPFSVNVEVGRAPWRPEHRLVRIGLKGREIPRDQRPPSNLVFLVDVSGSMASQNKLPLVKQGLTLLTEQLTEGDRAAIVTYSDTATLRLDSTNGDQRKVILDTINGLQAAGSTNGAGGIQLAYDTAAGHFIDGGTNRVILCTDGDFNVGVTSDDALVQLIQDRARTKVFFSVFGFGMGNLKDGKLEKLADKGNGHYAYIDGQREAHKVFVEELSANLVTIAKDVKLQVEFNPARVGGYRLIGYENRVLAAQDFNNDKKDAGDIGAGHTVTALYEILPADRLPQAPAGEGLRYQRVGLAQAGELGEELLTVKLRYKQPEADVSALLEVPVADPLPSAFDAEDRRKKLEATAPNAPSRPSRDFEWAAAVAAYGMVLRDSQFRGQAGLDLVVELAQGAKGEDANGRRQEFIELVQQTKLIRPDLAMPSGEQDAREAADRSPGEHPVAPLTAEQGKQRATVNQKYKNLLRIIPADGDSANYGAFVDFGRWEGTSYLGHDNLPQGYWVYVAPNWYIWGDAPGGEEPRKQ